MLSQLVESSQLSIKLKERDPWTKAIVMHLPRTGMDALRANNFPKDVLVNTPGQVSGRHVPLTPAKAEKIFCDPNHYIFKQPYTKQDIDTIRAVRCSGNPLKLNCDFFT